MFKGDGARRAKGYFIMEIIELLRRARSGDQAAREELIASNREFIRQTASKVCGRLLDWDQDEISVALIAFNEAIDAYREDKGVPFPAYARLVIKSRLSDHFRREARFTHNVALDDAAVHRVTAAGWEHLVDRLAAEERRQEVEAYRKQLAEFGLTLADLVAASPKHRDTRQNLLRAARILASREELFGVLMARKKVPLNGLAEASGLSIKALEKGRRYIIAVSLIFGFPDKYPYLHCYLAEC